MRMQPDATLEEYSETIEAIILDSVAQRDREYIVRQIRRINEPKP